jgi:hypothetical protein
MKIIYIHVFVLLALIGFIGCDVAEKDPNYDEHNTPTRRYVDYDHTTQTGKIIKYYASRKKKSVCYYEKGRKNGVIRSWYENGNKKLVIWYNKGKKDGLYQYYREDGPIYREIEYKDDLKEGQYQEFWKNGNLKYSLDYQHGYALDKTLREYKSTGAKKRDVLIIDEFNTVQKDGKYRLNVYFADLPKQAYYAAYLDGVPYILDMQNKKGVIEIDVPQGAFIMKKVQFEGFYEGKKKTFKTVKRSFNIGVENI